MRFFDDIKGAWWSDGNGGVGGYVRILEPPTDNSENGYEYPMVVAEWFVWDTNEQNFRSEGPPEHSDYLIEDLCYIHSSDAAKGGP